MRRILFCALALSAGLPSCGACDAPCTRTDAETDPAVWILEEAARRPVLLGPARLEEVARCLGHLCLADRRYWLGRLHTPRRVRLIEAQRALVRDETGAEAELTASRAALAEIALLRHRFNPPPGRPR